jgi:hypothetical protein
MGGVEDPDVKSLLAALVELTGESELDALKRALEERLARMKCELEKEEPSSDELFGY